MKTKHTENFMSRKLKVETAYIQGVEALEMFVIPKRVIQIEKD